MASILVSENDPRVADVRHRLDQFYAQSTDYESFQEENVKPEFWSPIRDHIAVILESGDGPCRVLEFGAGRTTFGDYLGELRSRVEFHVQDITDRHAEELKHRADDVHIGDLASVHDQFDVIFSTFVWEHVSNPRATLEHLLSLLKSGGSLFIACPRYDAPFYIPPSARHYSGARRITLGISLFWIRLYTALGGKPQFLIHIDPALFHRSWYRDADAIHWTSYFDFSRALPAGFRMQSVRLKSHGLRHWFWSRFLLLFVRITKL